MAPVGGHVSGCDCILIDHGILGLQDLGMPHVPGRFPIRYNVGNG